MMKKKRWRLVVKNIKGDPIAVEFFWTRWGAHRHGDAITSPPLNYYRVEKSNVPWRRAGCIHVGGSDPCEIALGRCVELEVDDRDHVEMPERQKKN